MQPGTPDQHARPQPPARPLGFAEKIPQHRLAQLEISDDPISQRADHGDRVRRAAFHLLGQVPHRAAAGENLAGALLHRDDGRLVEHQPFADQADQRVGRPQIDGQVAAEVMKQVLEHPCSPEGSEVRDSEIQRGSHQRNSDGPPSPRGGPPLSRTRTLSYRGTGTRSPTKTATNASTKRIV